MADSQGGGCLKGCGCFVLTVILLVIVSGLSALFFLDAGTISSEHPERLRAVTADICSCSVPESSIPLFGIDFPFVRGTLFMDSHSGRTNAYILTMDTTLVTSLHDEYNSLVEKMFDSIKPKSRKTLPLDPIYFNVTNRINRFATYMVLQNKEKRVVYEAYFSYTNRLVLAAYIARNTNSMVSGQAFIDSLGPPDGNEQK
jgi:hypothetical protein